MKKTIVCEVITSKQGQSANGKVYTKYSMKDATGAWYNSFNLINAAQGGEYEIEYEEGKFGNDLKSIKPVSVTENKTASMNRNNAIVRQHSQEMAIRYLTAQGQPFSIQDVKDMTDWFCEDVEGVELPF
jgi:hypothetical protein